MPQTYPSPARAAIAVLLLVVLAAGALGRAVPYTAFEGGRSPFEGRQMEAIERLRLRGASEKEIFARFPRPALVEVETGRKTPRWEGVLDGVLARLGVGGEERGVVESVEGGMAGGERVVGEVGEEMTRMGASGEMVDPEGELQERSHDVTGDGSLDGRDIGVTGTDKQTAAGDEHALQERAVDRFGVIPKKADVEHADSAAVEKRWTDDENEHAQNEEHQAAAKVLKNWKTSTEISVRADTAIEKRGLDMDMENGGLEVRGQMGGLKATRVGEA
ncbi:hypothetical protein MMC27_002889 [Xylographa pallens]|nr:hypothetical protein [Xylographa pallens]